MMCGIYFLPDDKLWRYLHPSKALRAILVTVVFISQQQEKGRVTRMWLSVPSNRVWCLCTPVESMTRKILVSNTAAPKCSCCEVDSVFKPTLPIALWSPINNFMVLSFTKPGSAANFLLLNKCATYFWHSASCNAKYMHCKLEIRKI